MLGLDIFLSRRSVRVSPERVIVELCNEPHICTYDGTERHGTAVRSFKLHHARSRNKSRLDPSGVSVSDRTMFFFTSPLVGH